MPRLLVPLLLGVALLGRGDSTGRLRADDGLRPWGYRPALRIIATQIPAGAMTGEAPSPSIDEPGGHAPAGLLDGSRIVLFDPDRPEAEPAILTPGFAAAGRPDLADDGARLLFVGRRAPGDRLEVWETELPGGTPRRVVGRSNDCLEAVWLSTLFTIDAEKPEPRICFTSRAETGEIALYTCRLDGSDERRIAFQPFGASSPLLLADGRLLFVSGQPPPATADGELSGGSGASLFTVNVDGTDVAAFTAAGEAGATCSSPCETGDGRVIYVETGANGGSPSTLVSVSVTRSLRSRQEIHREPAGRLDGPAALPDGGIMLSFRPSAGEATRDLWVLRPGDPGRLERVFASRDWHEVDPIPVTSRARRPGRSSVVDYRVHHGHLYGLEATLTDLAPNRRLGREKARAVEIVGAGRTLGSVPIEADGSFYARVPAQTPLRLRLVDDEGRPTIEMRNWIWVMPREARGCIGCHEDPELTPPNRHPLALRKHPVEIGK